MALNRFIIQTIACLILLSTLVNASLYASNDGKFIIHDVTAIVDGKSDLLDKYEDIDVRPGSKVQIKVTVESFYTSDDDVDIDVQLSGDIADIDGGSNINEDEDVELEPGQKRNVILEFEIPYATIDDDFDGEFSINAEADNGKDYDYDFGHKIVINKPDHELKIGDMQLSTDAISCEPSVGLTFQIINTGDHSEEDFKYIIENGAIGLHIQESNIMISEGEILEVNEIINVKNFPVGEHNLHITAVCNNEETSVRRTIILKKEACGTESTTTQPDSTSQTTQTTTQQPSTTTTQPSTTTNTQPNNVRVIGSRREPEMPTGLIISIAAIAIAFIVFLIMKKIKE
ncbi:hypothetical protein ACFLZ6_01215 [Nanoarchaeota archaeon]